MLHEQYLKSVRRFLRLIASLGPERRSPSDGSAEDAELLAGEVVRVLDEALKGVDLEGAPADVIQQRLGYELGVAAVVAHLAVQDIARLEAAGDFDEALRALAEKFETLEGDSSE